MNSKGILDFMKQVQERMYKVLKRGLKKTQQQLGKSNCYIIIPDNDIEILDRTCKQTRVPNSKDGLKVSLFVVEEGIVLNLRHYSPHLRTSYYNTNKKYKPLHSTTILLKNSIHMPLNNSGLLHLYSPSIQANSFLRQGFCNPLQYTSVRSCSSRVTNKKMVYKNSSPECLTTSEESSTELNLLSLDTLSEVRSANKTMITKATLKDADLSDTARRLLQDLNITGEDSETDDDANHKKSQKKENCYGIKSTNTSHICKFRDLKSIDVLSKMISKDNHTMIANYYQEKSKPFKIDSRVWSNYIRSHPVNTLQFNTNTKVKSFNDISHFEFYSTDLKKKELMCFRENDITWDKRIPNSFKEWLKSVKARLNYIISNITSKEGTCNDVPIGIRYKALFLKNNKLDLKKNISKHYDFNIQPTIKTNSTSLNVLDIVDNDLKESIVSHRKIRFPSKIELNEAPKKSFCKQFKRQNTSVINNKVVSEVEYMSRDEDPEALTLFCGTLKTLMLRLVELKTLRSLEKAIVTQIKTRSLEERPNKRNEESSPEDEINIENFHYPVNVCPKHSRFSLYSIQNEDKIENLSSKTTYVNIKVKPHIKDSISNIEIGDMKVSGNNDSKHAINNENNDRAIHMNSTELKENLDASNLDTLEQTKKLNKYVMLNLKLKIPFTPNHQTDKKIETAKGK